MGREASWAAEGEPGAFGRKVKRFCAVWGGFVQVGSCFGSVCASFGVDWGWIGVPFGVPAPRILALQSS